MAQSEPKENGTEQPTSQQDQNVSRPLGVPAIEASRVVAALAMQGANPWQRYLVFGSFAILLSTLVLILVPPYHETKQLTLSCLLVVAIMTGTLLVFRHYGKLIAPNATLDHLGHLEP